MGLRCAGGDLFYVRQRGIVVLLQQANITSPYGTAPTTIPNCPFVNGGSHSYQLHSVSSGATTSNSQQLAVGAEILLDSTPYRRSLDRLPKAEMRGKKLLVHARKLSVHDLGLSFPFQTSGI